MIELLDRGESPSLMEPMQIAGGAPERAALSDLVLDLAARSVGLRKSLPQGVATALAHLVRAMNCYYSNLIEGHHTHPVDIQRALRGDYSRDPEKRNLQREARAHIAVQAWIDDGGLAERALMEEGIREIHRRFCAELPEDLLWVQDPVSGERHPLTPGEWRTADVKIGTLVPISPGAIPRFIARFESAYAPLGKTERVLATAAAHHRLLWLHPFLDGNGRVARLMSYAVLHDVLDTGGLWSIARGLARNEADYKAHLAACDQPRRNDLDGRGHLSQEALIEFTDFFLRACIDQITFMENLAQPDKLRERIVDWARREIRQGSLPPHADRVLEATLYRGEIERGEVPSMLGVVDRHARRITTALLARGALTSTSPRAPLCLAFPAALAHEWMPGLFPEQLEG